MKILIGLWRWLHSLGGMRDGATSEPANERATPQPEVLPHAPPASAIALATPPPGADDDELAQLMAKYRRQRQQESGTALNATAAEAGDSQLVYKDLLNFYVTNGRDLEELHRFTTEVDQSLIGNYIGG